MGREEALYLEIDTSCHTTSIACVEHSGIVLKTMLRVHLGKIGLRQSKAYFSIVQTLGELLKKISKAGFDAVFRATRAFRR